MKTKNVKWIIALMMVIACPATVLSQEIISIVNKFEVNVKIKDSGDSISSVSEEEIKKQVDEAVDKEEEKIRNALEQEINKWKELNKELADVLKTHLLDKLDEHMAHLKSKLAAQIKRAKEGGFDAYTALATTGIAGGIPDDRGVLKAILKLIAMIVRILPEKPSEGLTSHEQAHVGLKVKLLELLERFVFPEGIKGFMKTWEEADKQADKLLKDWGAIVQSAEDALNRITNHGDTIPGAGVAEELGKVIADLIKKKFEEGKDMQKALTETKTIVEGLKTKEGLDKLKKSLKKE